MVLTPEATKMVDVVQDDVILLQTVVGTEPNVPCVSIGFLTLLGNHWSV